MKITRISLALLLIMAMFAVAEYGGQKEIIFPEIAALALGGWVMEKPPWSGSLVDLWLSPSLAALTGMLMVRYLPYAPLLMISGAFCLVVLQLKLLRSGILPSISAAILAIITRSDSWYYPLSVCIMTGIITLGRHALGRAAPSENPAHRFSKRASGQKTRDGWAELVHWCKLLAGVIAVSAVAVNTGCLFMVAPPLIVTFVELSKPWGSQHDKTGKILMLLAFAAFSGVLWFALIHINLRLPIWLGAGMAASTILCGYHVLRLPFPPAIAIALLPTIVPPESLWSYPWQVLCGSVALVALSKVCSVQAGQDAAMESVASE